LELQIPFSDPTADGPVITNACECSIKNGFKVKQIFDYINESKKAGFDRIIVMTYANIAFTYGIGKYVNDLKSAGVEAAIVPDLPLEDEEGFYQKSFECGLMPMPVVVINMPPERKALLEGKPFKKVYISIRVGITGKKTEITDDVKLFLDGLKNYERYAGFGIRSAGQVNMLDGHAEVAVVGSYFTAIIEQARMSKKNVYKEVKKSIMVLKSIK
jgi:tryptophan synthase alpha chain